MTNGLITTLITGFPLAEGGEDSGSSIEIGHHVQREFAGMTFNVDTIFSTLVAGAIVLIMGFILRSRLTKPHDHVPSKLQLIWEGVVGEVNRQVEDNLGRVHPYVAPLAISLFFFILIANWLELVPSKLNEDGPHLLSAPTADTNLTYALAAITIVSVWVYGIRTKGVKGYFSHFMEPFPVLLPLNILEELVKPITLALRLFGNMVGGHILLAIIFFLMGLDGLIGWALSGSAAGAVVGGLGGLVMVAFTVGFLFPLKLLVSFLQAFIFVMLTMLYIAGATEGAEHHGEQHAGHH